MASLPSENYQLKWHSFGTHLHSSVATALNSDAFTDVTLFTADGLHINAHRFVLSACSQYLQQVFKNQPKMATSLPVVVIMPPDINHKTLKTLVQYMYCGETTVSNDILENVLRGGDILQIRGLWRPSDQKETQHGRSELRTPVKMVVNNENVLKAVDSNVKTLTSQEKQTKTADNNPKKIQEKVVAESKTPDVCKNENIRTENRKDKGKGNDDNDLKYIIIKEEPIEWNELQDVEMEDNEMFHTEMTIKPEIIFPSEESEKEEEIYSPLTCELCSETFTLPAEWVRHIQTHTDMQPAKRQRRGKQADDDNAPFPPLQCDLCQKLFPTPADWVRHIQSTHTEHELAVSNNSVPPRPRVVKPEGVSSAQKMCFICNKKFPSHASMLIHKRTHTGERPFVCEYCKKGFNVKSNLLRHLRTLHDKIINSEEVSDGKNK